MGKVVQISILGKIYGNVNADEVIGTRITLKKMYSSGGEVLPFVSARAVKYAIRKAFKERGFQIDPLIENPEAEESLRLADSGDPITYIDNDLFGYMKTMGRGAVAVRRQAPVALSYFKALKDTPIKAEFAARFPRSVEKESNPVPFEVEVAEFVGRLNCIIYDYIGDFTEDANQSGAPETLKSQPVLPLNKRKDRLKTLLEILLTPSYVLPRRTNSLNIPEYIAALVSLSTGGPLPIYQYLNYNFELNKVDEEALNFLSERIRTEFNNMKVKLFYINYLRTNVHVPQNIQKIDLPKLLDEVCKFYFEEKII